MQTEEKEDNLKTLKHRLKTKCSNCKKAKCTNYKCQDQTEMTVKMVNKLTYWYNVPEVLYKNPK